MLRMRLPAILLSFLSLLPAQETTLSLTHRDDQTLAGTSRLVFSKQAVSLTQERDGRRIKATIERDAARRVNVYESIAEDAESGRELGRTRLEWIAEERAYLLREDGPLGSRNTTIRGPKVRLLVDAGLPALMLPTLLEIDGGFLSLIDLGRRKSMGVVHLDRLNARTKILRLEGGPVQLSLAEDGSFEKLQLSERPARHLVPLGTTSAERSPPPGVTERALGFPRPGEAAARNGKLCLPSGSGPFPGVVLVPGAGARDVDGEGPGLGSGLTRDLAWDLARVGVASLRYEKRDVHARWAELRGDLEAALDFFGDQKEVDQANLSVVGFGEGALLAAQVLAIRGKALRAGIYLSPPARALPGALEAALRADLADRDAPSEAVAREVQSLRESLEVLAQAENAAALPVESRLLKDLLGIDPMKTFVGTDQPFMILYGSEDRRVPIGHRSLLRTALALQGAARYRFQTLSQADHEFVEIGLRKERTGRHPALVPFITRFLREVGGLQKSR